MGSNFYGLFYILLFIVFGIGMILLFPFYEKYDQAKRDLSAQEDKLQARQLECESLRLQIHDMEHNPQAIENAARVRYGLSREGEKIYIYGKF